MKKETLYCSRDDFFEHYFIPSPASNVLNKVLETMRAKAMLVPRPKEEKTKGVTTRKLPPVPGHPFQTASPANLNNEPPFPQVLKEFSRKPSEGKRLLNVKEKAAFASLEKIGQGIRTCMKEAGVPVNDFELHMVPDDRWSSDIEGCNYRIDACIKPIAQGKAEPLHVSKMTVPFEFKLKRNDRGNAENRLQLVSAVTHLMNDDVSRNFVYGMTIEDDRASLWYFSRGHSVKATSFSLIQRPDLLVRILVSLFSASREDLGYSSHITRLDDGSFLYQLDNLPVHDVPHEQDNTRLDEPSLSEADSEKPLQGDAETTQPPDEVQASDQRQSYFFKTTQIVSEIRNFRIAGRNTRIWKAVEVVSKDNLTPKDNGREIILKDAWIDHDAVDEFDIQQQLFRDIDVVKQGNWQASALLSSISQSPSGAEMTKLGEYLKDDSYKDLFLRFDEKMRYTSKPSKSIHPQAWNAPADVFGFTGVAYTNSVDPIDYSKRTGSMSNSSRQKVTHQGTRNVRSNGLTLAPKKRCLFVFPDTCTRVSHVPTLGDAMDVLHQAFYALLIMFCAGWVHRDISDGNILAINVDGKWAAKLAAC